LCLPPAAEAATGPYTLPFFDPTIVLTQACHQGCAYDYGTAYKPIAASRAGQVVDLRTGQGPGECNPYTTKQPNFVKIRHADNQHTTYYHLSAVNVGPNQQVNAGQQIGISGNSGYACGAHLHYGLYSSGVTSSANSLVPNGRWTTDPGRVPWRAQYVSESHPSGYTSFLGVTVNIWVKFKNIGGQTWTASNPANNKGRIFLAAVTNSGTATRNSYFWVPNTPPPWEGSQWLVGAAGISSVAPNATGTFAFPMKGSAYGTFNERFNLRANSLWWFDYYETGGINGWYVGPITIEHCC
jgi:murein DD-endopeptidase MepM/ murein hydrolase activator NlpD